MGRAIATANSNEVEYDYPVGYEPEVQTETVELDHRTVERLDALRGGDESYDELITELTSIFTANGLPAVRVDSPLIERRLASSNLPYLRRVKRGIAVQRTNSR